MRRRVMLAATAAASDRNRYSENTLVTPPPMRESAFLLTSRTPSSRYYPDMSRSLTSRRIPKFHTLLIVSVLTACTPSFCFLKMPTNCPVGGIHREGLTRTWRRTSVCISTDRNEPLSFSTTRSPRHIRIYSSVRNCFGVYHKLREWVKKKGSCGEFPTKRVAAFEEWRPFNHPSTWDTNATILLQPPSGEQLRSLAGRLVVVTGANAGIGREAVKGYALRGATVVMGCRSEERGAAAVNCIVEEAKLASEEQEADLRGRLVVTPLELSSLPAVKSFAQRVQALPLAQQEGLDILHLSAGTQPGLYAGTEDGSDVEYAFAANFLGHFYLTHLLGSELTRAARAGGDVRVVMLSSNNGHANAPPLGASWDALVGFNASMVAVEQALSKTFKFRALQQLVPPGAPVANRATFKRYALSKLACTLMVRELARRLPPARGISVTAVSPGATVAPALLALRKMILWPVRWFWWLLLRWAMFTSAEAGATALYPALGVPREGKWEIHDAYLNPAGRRKPWGLGVESAPVADLGQCRRLWDFAVSRVRKVDPAFKDYYAE